MNQDKEIIRHLQLDSNTTFLETREEFIKD